MKKFKLLVLTDHSTHSKENSLYALMKALREHPACELIDVASRGNSINAGFFHSFYDNRPFVSRVTDNFTYHNDGRCFKQDLKRISLREYDAIFLRLPHPTPKDFWPFLRTNFPENHIFNRPSGVEYSSSKAFLLEVPELCPPIELCRTPEDILAFKSQFPIVLKPLRGYGGEGIIKIDGEEVWLGMEKIDFNAFLDSLSANPQEYLGMKYLKNVHQGDKRVVVINGHIYGASLRLPATNSWLCNNSQGGSSGVAKADSEEIYIAQRLHAVLSELGVIFFGFDTLVDDDGKRVLSEVNTMSIGGIMQIDRESNEPLLEKAAGWIWDYIKNDIYEKCDKVV